eukprot:TRINITY_DN4386_c0_g1_i1.p1 TRINITY_DN4386_c0_g1~~TRINITY_DN4386_c0_g1_i1.p1  ORF type:complete len:221 (+),score=41.43 TRINITY_DN4386_c0_g1_i1:95-757(+)
MRMYVVTFVLFLFLLAAPTLGDECTDNCPCTDDQNIVRENQETWGPPCQFSTCFNGQIATAIVDCAPPGYCGGPITCQPKPDQCCGTCVDSEEECWYCETPKPVKHIWANHDLTNHLNIGWQKRDHEGEEMRYRVKMEYNGKWLTLKRKTEKTVVQFTKSKIAKKIASKFPDLVDDVWQGVPWEERTFTLRVYAFYTQKCDSIAIKSRNSKVESTYTTEI